MVGDDGLRSSLLTSSLGARLSAEVKDRCYATTVGESADLQELPDDWIGKSE